MTKIAIIGAGYSGTAVAVNLHRASREPLEIVLIDKRGTFGLGDAYSTPYVFHLLNVRVEDMSAFEEEPSHFADWLRARPELLATLDAARPLEEQFVPRLYYGNYLQDLLSRAQHDKHSSVKLKLITADIHDIVIENDRAVLKSHQHQDIIADKVVLALGNNPACSFPFPVSPAMNVIDNPWDFTAPKKIHPSQTVLIVGTGLSMIDAVLTLHHQQHTGPIYALSRRGLLPLKHAAKKSRHEMDAAHLPATLRATTRFLREHSQASSDWRAIIDAFRKHIGMCWDRASIKEKKQFLRHVLPYWNIHRHRVHTEIAELLERLIENKQLTLLAGQVMRVDGQYAHIKIRHKKEIEQLPIHWLINCMGPQLKTHRPLLQSMQSKGLAVFDPLNLGLVTAKEGALQINSGEYSKMFYTLGALTKGSHWEITSVPAIRKQCSVVAKQLARSIP